MSRVGNRVLTIPEGVTVSINGTTFEAKGPKGTISREFSSLISITSKDSKIATVRANEDKHTKQLHGTTNSHISSMLEGVSKGFEKKLEIRGVGYKSELKGEKLIVHAGYSHPVILDIPKGIEVKVPKPLEITVSGISKELVGQMAANIKAVRKPNPYSGKGIRYFGEQIILKEGKTAGK